MTQLRRFLFRLVSFFQSHHAESDLAREIHAHLQLLEDELEIARRAAGEPQVAGVTLALHPIGQEATSWIDVEGVALPNQPDDYRVGKAPRWGSACG